MPQQPADIPGLVRRLREGSVAEQAQAASALHAAFLRGAAGRDDGPAAAITEAGGISALLQLVGSQDEHPGAESACSLLCDLGIRSPARCRAIIAAGGIAPLARCLEGSHTGVQAAAAGALANLAVALGGGEAGRAAVAAVAIPATIRLLSSSADRVLAPTVALLGRLARGPGGQRHPATVAAAAAVITAGGIPPLVRLLEHRSSGIVEGAAATLSLLSFSEEGPARIVAAGAVPLLMQVLATSSHAGALQSTSVVDSMLLLGPASIAVKVIEAVGIAALIRCLPAADTEPIPRGTQLLRSGQSGLAGDWRRGAQQKDR